MKDVEKYLAPLRKYTQENVETKNEIIPDDEDFSKGNLDKVYDIDIFISRKPGMRRSVQLITSGAENKQHVRVSAITALFSLADNMTTHEELGVTVNDIINGFLIWLEQYNLSLEDLKEIK